MLFQNLAKPKNNKIGLLFQKQKKTKQYIYNNKLTLSPNIFVGLDLNEFEVNTLKFGLSFNEILENVKVELKKEKLQ